MLRLVDTENEGDVNSDDPFSEESGISARKEWEALEKTHRYSQPRAGWLAQVRDWWHKPVVENRYCCDNTLLTEKKTGVYEEQFEHYPYPDLPTRTHKGDIYSIGPYWMSVEDPREGDLALHLIEAWLGEKGVLIG